jgi:hypothetical protein
MSLPDELWTVILAESGAPLFVLRQVCRQFHQVAEILAGGPPPKRRAWCYHCMQGGARKRDGDSYRLCPECRVLPDYRRLCKSNVKKVFKLTDKDLRGIEPVTYGFNPYYRSAPMMMLFSYREMEALAVRKYGAAIVAKRIREQEEKPAPEALPASPPQIIPQETAEEKLRCDQEHWQRKQTLRDALAGHGLELRSDSTLCAQYINGTSDRSLEDIVLVMREMAWFHAHTKYAQYRQAIFEESRYWSSDDEEGEGNRLNPVSISEEAQARALDSWADRNQITRDLSGVPESLYEVIQARWAKRRRLM